MSNLHRTLVADAVARVLLRPYQQDVRDSVEYAWANGYINVLAVLPTGAGKTVLFSSIIADEPGATCAIAHRQELVSQISLALARNRVRHRIVGPQNVIKMIVRLHMEEVGANYYDPNSRCAVAGVDTLIRREKQLANWLPTVKLWVQDECHHVLKENKWGKAVEMFPNARGLGVTATPCRADGQGLGRHADGVFDTMVIGPTMRDLIKSGNLTDYKLYAPPSNFDRDSLKVSSTTGDFVASSVSKAVATSNLVTHTDGKVVGDVVTMYKKLLDGMLTIVFAPDVKTAYELESQYSTAGIPAKCLHGGTPDDERQAAIREFKNKKIMVLINVSLFDEGFDLPAVEAVQDVAATGSFGRFVQRVGRALRLKEGKLFGRYVDHVGNIAQHCTVVTYADGETKIEVCHREWTLDRREKRTPGKSDAPQLRFCLNVECSQPFERFRKVCPYCSTAIPEPEGRTAVEFVDGDITELDPTAFAQMRADVARVDISPQDYHAQLSAQGVPQIGIMANVKRHIVRQGVVGELRDVLAHWAGAQRAAGLSDGEIYRKFYLSHGVDMITCQTAKVDEMQQLIERVRG
ncbi:MAG: DEAD/DEAH box helicase [Plesiomonas sp.]